MVVLDLDQCLVNNHQTYKYTSESSEQFLERSARHQLQTRKSGSASIWCTGGFAVTE
jgi:hypothetical protein